MITTVCPPDHRHGDTSTCYSHHQCRCDGCRANWSARRTRISKQKAYGRYQSPYIDATPAREHVQQIHATGMSLKAIALAAGVHATTVVALVQGRASAGEPPHLSRYVRSEVASALLAVEASLDLYPDTARYTGRGVIRRLQALVARGWSMSAIGRQMGAVSPQRVEQMMHAERTTMGVHRRVAAVYDLLWDQVPPSATQHQRASYVRSVNRARKYGWLPPLAWDDIDTDEQPPALDVDAAIDEMAVELACSGERVDLNRAERRAVVTELHGRRWSDIRIAAYAGCDERTVLRIRKELGLDAFDYAELVKMNAA